MKKEHVISFAIIIAVVFFMAAFRVAVHPCKIPTNAMAPALRIGDSIFIDTVTYKFQEPRRGDVILFSYPLNPKVDMLKRIIGMPKEQLRIDSGNIFIYGKLMDTVQIPRSRIYLNKEEWEFGKKGQAIQIPADSYFVLGDHSAYSADSRQWGFVKKKNVIGKAFYIFSPSERRGKIS